MPTPTNVTLRQLRAFLAVAAEGHFTRAADKLDVSQSTISTLIRELEANLGLRLFDRHTRALRLTQAGEEIVGLAHKSLTDLDRALGGRQAGQANVHSLSTAPIFSIIYLIRIPHTGRCWRAIISRLSRPATRAHRMRSPGSRSCRSAPIVRTPNHDR